MKRPILLLLAVLLPALAEAAMVPPTIAGRRSVPIYTAVPTLGTRPVLGIFAGILPPPPGGDPETLLTGSTDDRILVDNGSAWQRKAVPDCDDSGGNHLNYDTATNAFSCGTSSGASGITFGGATGGTAHRVLFTDLNGNLADNSAFTFTASTGKLLSTRFGAGDGTEGAPAFHVATTSTGIYSNSTPDLAFAVAGGAVFRLMTTAAILNGGTTISWSSASPQTTASDTHLGREGIAILQQGADSASPISQTLKAPDGVGSNIAGGNHTIAAGRSTGTGAGGNLIRQTSPSSTSSSSTANALVDREVVVAGAKALTGGSPIAVVRVAIASGTTAGGAIRYSVLGSDGTDFQERSGEVRWTMVNKGGTETCKIGGYDGTADPTETKDGSILAESNGASTLTYTWTTVVGTNTCDLTLNAGSSLTETVLNIQYTITRERGTGAITPQ